MEAKPDLKAMSGKEKASYIWEYYKLHIFAGIIAVVIAATVIYQVAAHKDTALNIIMLDAYNPYGEEPAGLSDFFDQEGLNEATQKISFDLFYSSDFYDKQTLAIQLTVGNADVFISPEEQYDSYAAAGCMADLTDYFTADELEQYADILIYTADADTNRSYPCGLRLTENPWIEANGYGGISCSFGITHNSEAAEIAADFLRFVLNYK